MVTDMERPTRPIESGAVAGRGVIGAGILMLLSSLIGCGESEPVVSDAGTETDSDQREIMYDYKAQDIGSWLPDGGVDEVTVYEERIVVCQEALCAQSSMGIGDCGIPPFLTLVIAFHDGYPLVGTHDFIHDAPPPFQREGFNATYCDGDGGVEEDCAQFDWYVYAVAGTATVSKDGDSYVIDFEVTMEDGTHFEGVWTAELCGTPVPEV
jgi:hypothetical protein